MKLILATSQHVRRKERPIPRRSNDRNDQIAGLDRKYERLKIGTDRENSKTFTARDGSFLRPARHRSLSLPVGVFHFRQGTEVRVVSLLCSCDVCRLFCCRCFALFSRTPPVPCFLGACNNRIGYPGRVRTGAVGCCIELREGFPHGLFRQPSHQRIRVSSVGRRHAPSRVSLSGTRV